MNYVLRKKKEAHGLLFVFWSRNGERSCLFIERDRFANRQSAVKTKRAKPPHAFSLYRRNLLNCIRRRSSSWLVNPEAEADINRHGILEKVHPVIVRAQTLRSFKLRSRLDE